MQCRKNFGIFPQFELKHALHSILNHHIHGYKNYMHVGQSKGKGL